MTQLANASIVHPRNPGSNLGKDRKKFMFCLCSIWIQIFINSWALFININVQWGSKYQTSPVFEWSISPITGHLITRPLKKLDIFVFKWSAKLDHLYKNILFYV
jgi:hypothetical protein